MIPHIRKFHVSSRFLKNEEMTYDIIKFGVFNVKRVDGKVRMTLQAHTNDWYRKPKVSSANSDWMALILTLKFWEDEAMIYDI